MDDDVQDDELVTIVVGEGRPEVPVVQDQPVWDVDEICAAAVERARDAVLEEADRALIGEHTGLVADGPLVVTHYFEGHVPGYTGWRWAVTVTRAPDDDTVTVDETALLPDGDALLAPAWVPWKKRIQPGDIGAGDVLVTEPDDPRLLPGMSQTDAPAVEDEDLRPAQWELGLGRVRVLSPEGRREAAQRWYREVGPRAAVARGTDLTCASCGFLLLVGGPLGQAFGVCANGYSPADGRVVAMTFGCGAHSETTQSPPVPVAQIVVDEVGYDDAGPLPEAEEAGEAGADTAAAEEAGEAAPDAEETEQPDEVPQEVSGSEVAAEPVGEAEPAAESPEAADVPRDGQDAVHATMQGPDAEEGA
jgi:hypothetical protein